MKEYVNYMKTLVTCVDKNNIFYTRGVETYVYQCMRGGGEEIMCMLHLALDIRMYKPGLLS